MDRYKRGEVRPAERNQSHTAAENRIPVMTLSRSAPCMKTAQPAVRVLQDTGHENDATHTGRLKTTPPIPIPVPSQKKDAVAYAGLPASASEEADETDERRQQPVLVARCALQSDPAEQDGGINDPIVQLTLLMEKAERLSLSKRQHGRSSLHWACIKGDAGIIRLLCAVSTNQEINLRDLDGKTALYYLLKAHFVSGRAPLVTMLLERGADLSLLPDRGASLAHAPYMTTELAFLLAQRGMDFNSKSRFAETPLMIACDKADISLVKFLLAHHANPATTGTMGRTALHNGHLPMQIARCLIGAKAAVDATNDLGETPLMLACEAGNLPLIVLLLIYGASPQAVCTSGQCVLDYAKKTGGLTWEYLRQYTREASPLTGARNAVAD
jgi:ankyrin repeat protein